MSMPSRLRQRRDLFVAQGPHIMEDIDRLLHARAHCVAGLRSIGVSMDAKAAAVLQFKQPRHQMHGGMVMKIGGEIADGNLRLA